MTHGFIRCSRTEKNWCYNHSDLPVDSWDMQSSWTSSTVYLNVKIDFTIITDLSDNPTPIQTTKENAEIPRNAFRLWCKGAKFFAKVQMHDIPPREWEVGFIQALTSTTMEATFENNQIITWHQTQLPCFDVSKRSIWPWYDSTRGPITSANICPWWDTASTSRSDLSNGQPAIIGLGDFPTVEVFEPLSLNPVVSRFVLINPSANILKVTKKIEFLVFLTIRNKITGKTHILSTIPWSTRLQVSRRQELDLSGSTYGFHLDEHENSRGEIVFEKPIGDKVPVMYEYLFDNLPRFGVIGLPPANEGITATFRFEP